MVRNFASNFSFISNYQPITNDVAHGVGFPTVDKKNILHGKCFTAQSCHVIFASALVFVSLVLVLLRLNAPVNNFSVMSGRSHSFLGITSTFQGVNVSLLKDTTWQRWVSNPQPLAPESESLGHRAPSFPKCPFSWFS